MKNIIRFKTTNNNHYLYNRSGKYFIYIPPLFNEIIDIQDKKTNLDQYFESITDPTKKTSAKYYLKKYQFLKKHLYSNKFDEVAQISTRLSKKIVTDKLMNEINLVFEVTEKCNLKCTYCSYGSNYKGYDIRTGKNIEFEIAKKTIDHLITILTEKKNDKKNDITIGFFGGEPLLNIGFILKIVNYMKLHRIKSKFSNITYTMTTNGLLIRKHINFLIENKFNLLLSLDGDDTSNSYRVYHNGDKSFNEVFNNFLYIKNEFPEYYKRHIKFNAVITDKSSISSIIKFYKKKLSKIPMISEIALDRVAEGKKSIMTSIYKEYFSSFQESGKYAKICENANLNLVPGYKNIQQIIEELLWSTFSNYNNLLLKHSQEKLPTGTCIPLTTSIYVTTHGKILPCVNVDYKYSFGTASSSIIDFDIQNLVDKTNGLYDQLMKQCKSCYAKNICNVCMFQLPIISNELVCHKYKNHSKYSAYLSKHTEIIESRPTAYKKIINRLNAELSFD